MDNLSPEAYRQILEALPIGVYLVDLNRRILLWSQGAQDLTGYLRQEVVGRCCRDELLMHCDQNDACVCGALCPLQQTLLDGQPTSANLFLLQKDGGRLPVTVRAAPIRNEHGSIVGAVECFDRRIVFASAEPAPRPVPCVSRDEITGLPDRPATEKTLRAYFEGAEDGRVQFGVLSIEVDGIAQLSQRHGMLAVRAVLHATGQTLASVVTPNDAMGRWSERRFLAVIAGCTAPALARAAQTMQRLVQLEGVRWWGDRLPVSVSIGEAMVQTGDTPESIVRRAEEALARVVQE